MPVTIAFAHATGFCGAVWRPVVDALTPGFAAVTWDFPNHGSGPRVPLPLNWWVFGEWARKQVADLAHPIVGVGHSMGGAALVMAELLSPNTFSALVLIEPMILPPPYRRTEGDLSRGVRKRKRAFDSRQAARENFASKPPFDKWHPAALDGYIDCGLIESEAGAILACTPEAESDIYQGATAHGAWGRAGEIDVPTLIMAGSDSDVFPADYARSVANQFGRAGSEIVARADHFLPMEHPEVIARRIDRISRGLATSANEPAEPSPSIEDPGPAEPEPALP